MSTYVFLNFCCEAPQREKQVCAGRFQVAVPGELVVAPASRMTAAARKEKWMVVTATVDVRGIRAEAWRAQSKSH